MLAVSIDKTLPALVVSTDNNNHAKDLAVLRLYWQLHSIEPILPVLTVSSDNNNYAKVLAILSQCWQSVLGTF